MLIPREFWISTDHVYIQQNPQTGGLILSEKPPEPAVPPRPDWNEIWRMLDEAGAADFELERDQGPPEDRDWFNP